MKPYVGIVMIIVILIFAMGACSKAGEPEGSGLGDISALEADVPDPTAVTPAPEEIDFTIDISRIDGSTATFPLMEATLKKLFGSSEGLQHNRTDMAYMLLTGANQWATNEYGEKDVIFVTYPSEEEFRMAEEAGCEFEIIPVVKDALVFLVNADNPVTNLTRQQIQDIYTGKIQNWKEVGGRDESITAFQRPVNSGSQTLFLKLAMEGKTPTDAPTEIRPSDMQGLIDSVASYDFSGSAIGYSVFYYASEMYARDDVKLISIDGVMPTPETIASEDYPYLTYYYAVLLEDNSQDSNERKLINWMLSPDGQRTAAEAGYVPLDAENIEPVDNEKYYGFFGSTPENTTKSSGTGGTDAILFDDLEYSEYIEMEGHVKLSDIFYDGVNYIDYINRELRAKLYGNDDIYDLKHSFTGIPNDYQQFELLQHGYVQGDLIGVSLGIHFDENNPFFQVSEYGEIFSEWVVWINLPLDLSPHGSVWKLDYTKEKSHGDYDVMVPKITTCYLSNNPADEKINAGIRALYEKAYAAGCFPPDEDHMSRGPYENDFADIKIREDKLYVGFGKHWYQDIGTTYSDEFEIISDSAKSPAPVFTKVTASSTRAPMGSIRYDAALVVDEDPATAWCEGVKGAGIGEWLEFRADSMQQVKSIFIMNGYSKSDQVYNTNNRVKAITVTGDNGFSEKFTLEEVGYGTYQKFTFSKPVDTTFLKIVIDDVYLIGDGEDTLISEIIIR